MAQPRNHPPKPRPQITRATTLGAPIDRVWQALLRPETLAYVARGWLSVTPVDPSALPATWSPGAYRVRLTAHGLLPLGEQVLGIEVPPVSAPQRALRDNGHGRYMRVWDHLITLDPVGDQTLYTDRVRIDAGALTPLVVLWARGFYAHRQRRWHRLVARDFTP